MDQKNLRRASVLVTAQTLHHLRKMAGSDNPRDLGRELDKMMITERRKKTWKKRASAGTAVRR